MGSSTYSAHYSVMLRDCLGFFREEMESEQPGAIADMTFGAGGHTLALARAFPEFLIFSTDQDPEAFANGKKIISEGGFEEQVSLLKMNFAQFPEWYATHRPKAPLLGILMDLGVSSHHFDSFERGFSFREDAPLDMRMASDDDSTPTAAWTLNHLSEEELADIIFEYGEERLARKIAKKIVEERSKKPLTSTKELENICFHAYPPAQRHKKTHPATRTFQALRIHTNRELQVLSDTLPKLFGMLAPGGILQVISFHSLEDRIVKRTFKDIFQSDKNAAKILTKRPLTPSEEELAENPRSRSAKLRVIKKLDQDNPGGVGHGGKSGKNQKKGFKED